MGRPQRACTQRSSDRVRQGCRGLMKIFETMDSGRSVGFTPPTHAPTRALRLWNCAFLVGVGGLEPRSLDTERRYAEPVLTVDQVEGKRSSASRAPITQLRGRDWSAQLRFLCLPFEQLNNSGQEFGGWGTINKGVVECQAERHEPARDHGTDLVEAGHSS